MNWIKNTINVTIVRKKNKKNGTSASIDTIARTQEKKWGHEDAERPTL